MSNVEGIDIIIKDKNNMYAIEVKTTSGEKIKFKKKDFDGSKYLTNLLRQKGLKCSGK